MKHDLDLNIEIKLSTNQSVEIESQGYSGNSKYSYEFALKGIIEKLAYYLEKTEQNYQDIDELTFKLKKITAQKTISCEEQFFYELLDKTEKVFQHSETKKKYPNENWNFAICDTPIQKGKGLFFGLNWGGNDINQQSVYPAKHKKREWRFIQHARKFINEFIGENIEDLNYSNLCFFRTPSLKELVNSDWDIAIKLFSEFADFIKPEWSLMIGSPPDILKSSMYMTDLKVIKLIDTDSKRERTIKGYTGMLFGRYPFGSVPHPQSHYSDSARKMIWKAVTEQLNEKVKTQKFINGG